MKFKQLSIICAVTTSFLFNTNIFAEEHSFVRKIEDGGRIFNSIQTSDGRYVYLNNSSLTKIQRDGVSTSEIALSFDIPEYGFAGLSGIVQSGDGLILVGSAQLSGYYGNSSATIIKVGSNGRIESAATYAPPNDGNLWFQSVISTSDGGFVVTGGIYPPTYHPVVIKFNSARKVIWAKSFESLSYEFLSIATLDGGVILTADRFQDDGHPLGSDIIKVDDSGNIVWAVTLKMDGFSLHSLVALNNNRYLIAGKGSDPNTLLLVNLNPDGTIASKAAYALNIPDFYVTSLAKTKDGGAAIGGSVRNQSGSFYDGLVMKIDNRLKPIFQKRLGVQGKVESIVSIVEKEDGSYLLFGSSSTETLIFGLRSDGSGPLCGFSHNFAVSNAGFGRLTHEKLTLTAKPFSLVNGGPLKVKSKFLHHAITNVCAK